LLLTETADVGRKPPISAPVRRRNTDAKTKREINRWVGD
jgi:hypothetical protein